MKHILSILLLIFSASGFGQEWIKQPLPSPEFENQQIEALTQLLSVAHDSTHYLHYDDRAIYKYHLRDYTGAMEDVNASIELNSDYCHAHFLRGTLLLRLENREEACLEFEIAKTNCPKYSYEEEFAYQCDDSWHYMDTIRVHHSDTLYLTDYGSRKKEFFEKGNPFIIFYDEDLTRKKEFLYQEKDTIFHRDYYENGQIKKLDKTMSEMGLWFYSAEWCENGQLITELDPKCEKGCLVKKYLCDGTISMEYLDTRFGTRGIFRLYHNNGQLADQGNYEATSSVVGEQKVGFWESFSPEGIKTYEAFYENGVIVWEMHFD